MKRYIKSSNYVNLDENIDELIRDFDPYIVDREFDWDEDIEDYGDGKYVGLRIRDRNSDFDEWIDVDSSSGDWEWNRELFRDNDSYLRNVKTIMNDNSVIEKIDELINSNLFR